MSTKTGNRKDIDLIIYSDKTFWSRQETLLDTTSALLALTQKGFRFNGIGKHQWCNKATYRLDFEEHNIDFLTPEAPHNEYTKQEEIL